MREGIHWRGSNRARGRQQEYSPNQSFVLPSGRQARGRAANVLVFCLILCFVTWTLSRFRTPASPISTERLPHQAPARAVVLELFRYYRHPQARNRSFTALAPEHRRRRGLLEESETTTSSPQEILDEEEQEEQRFDGVQFVGENLTAGFDSLKKRKGCNNDHDLRACTQGASSSTQGASSSPRGALAEWPLLGGRRKCHQELESVFAKVELRYDAEDTKEYLMHIDSGSGQTWVNFRGSAVVGPNGLYKPRPDSFLNCESNRDICKVFQDGLKYRCDSKHNFRCLYEIKYGDGTISGGSAINSNLRFRLRDGSRSQRTIVIGCSTEGKGADPVGDYYDTDDDEPPSPRDGILGLGRHSSGLLSQLHSLDVVSEYVFAVCLESTREDQVRGPGPRFLVMQSAGFLSLGDLYTSEAATTVCTASIVPQATRRQVLLEEIITARLVGIKYRDWAFSSKRKRKREDDDNIEVATARMGFDTGSDLTYLHPGIFNRIAELLDRDATEMGYLSTSQDAEKRKCWFDAKHGRRSFVKEFGDLIMKFSSLEDDDTTSDFVIKPENYITFGGDYRIKTCFNMRKEREFSYGHLGVEAMKGHLLIFNQRANQIGWSPVTSCNDLR